MIGLEEFLKENKSFYIYRLPFTTEVIMEASPVVVKGLHEGGFVVAPFDLRKNPILSLMPHDFPSLDYICPTFPFPSVSTSKSHHANGVRVLSTYHRTHGGKTVLSRVLRLKVDVDDLPRVFNNLLLQYPGGMVFAFSTPQTGLWMGATPELLLSGKDSELKTMALAGTRSSGCKEEWDSKNLNEQQMVVDFILQILKDLNPQVSARFTKNAGPIEHLCTPISAFNPKNKSVIEKLLRDLSPTPALCGSDREKSFSFIEELETHSRGYYGGFIGPYSCSSNFDFFVNLRSMQHNGESASLYVGGGITGDSHCEGEWLETERKAESLLKAIFLR